MMKVSKYAVVFTVTALMLTIGLATASTQPSQQVATGEDAIFFETHVRPVLSESCLSCHSEVNPGGMLRLDKPLTVSQVAKVIGRLTGVGGARMPLNAPPISNEKIQQLRLWQTNGAKWPTLPAPIDGNLWSLKPVKLTTPQKNLLPGWSGTPIDRFLAMDFIKRGVVPSLTADRKTILRRAAYLLTGLPTTYVETMAFVSDKSLNAYEVAIDKLLASPRYGERMARLWMDIARYSDTKGYVFVEDRNYPNAYTYRDWLITSFNSDLSYDQFVIQQLAADKLVTEDRKPLAALGFLTIGRRFLNAENDIIGDRIDVTTRGFLGLTVQCARCHDHKFDPIPTRDYYSMYSIFASSQENTPAISDKGIRDPWESHNKVLENVNNTYQVLLRSSIAKLRTKVEQTTPGPSVKVREALQATALNDLPTPERLPILRTAFSREETEELDSLLRQAAELKSSRPPQPEFAMAMMDKSSPVTVNIHKRGNPGSPGDLAPRQFLRCISGEKRDEWVDSGRLQLAKSIVSTDNPLTARVFVNRVWMNVFGKGIVRTPSDFGKQGEKPSNPALLDYLAYHFMHTDGWSVKKLYKRILLTQAFKTASIPTASATLKDPENRLVTHQNLRRLDLEQLRDSLLYVSGSLDVTRVGGKSEELWTPNYTPRRTLYGFIERQNLPLTFKTFDYASPDTTSPMRFTTTVPQQALFMMNSPLVTAQARALAALRNIKNVPDKDAITGIFQSALCRKPTLQETKVFTTFLSKPDTDESIDIRALWLSGYGTISGATDRVTDFKELPFSADGQHRGGLGLPDPNLGWTMLDKDGGHPGTVGVMSIRRFTSPGPGTVSISGSFGHMSASGDGVRARVMSSRHGQLGSWTVQNRRTPTNLPNIAIVKGEFLYFVVDCIADDSFDSYNWSPIIQVTKPVVGGLANGTWKASDAYIKSTEYERPLTRLERLAQVLLMSNEFAHVD